MKKPKGEVKMPREKKPIVLTFAKYYIPSFKSGGPVRTIANMVTKLGDRLDFWIFCRDRDSFEDRPFDDVVVDAWTPREKATVFYASPSWQKLWKLRAALKEVDYDVIYLNSYFDYRFTVLPLIAIRLGLISKKPIVIAPRGEFSPGALRIRSTKKTLYIQLSRFLGLYRGVVWQASSEYEAADIRRTMGRTAIRIIIAPDLPGGHADELRPMQSNHSLDVPLRIVFLSRVSPKKNLEFALRVLHQVDCPISFHVYGVIDDDGYWKKCLSLARELPSNVHFEYKGYVNHENVTETLSSYDLFFLPTEGENYGHVIHEALIAGTPVLISDLTPWRELAALGIGWDLSLNEFDPYVEIIQQLANESSENRKERRASATKYARSISDDPQITYANLKLFENLL